MQTAIKAKSALPSLEDKVRKNSYFGKGARHCAPGFQLMGNEVSVSIRREQSGGRGNQGRGSAVCSILGLP
jgi:hypothetical protein